MLRAYPALLALLLLPAPLLARQPALAFEDGSIVASEVTAQGEVVWFGISREIQGFAARMVRHEAVLADDDGDGQVRLVLDGEVPSQSIWVAVDLATGEAAVGVPGGYPRRERLPRLTVRGGGPGRLDRLAESMEVLEALLVRPGVGAWRLSAAEGGPQDEDGVADGLLEASLAGARPLGATTAPLETVAAGDVAVVIDPTRMEFYAVRLNPAMAP